MLFRCDLLLLVISSIRTNVYESMQKKDYTFFEMVTSFKPCCLGCTGFYYAGSNNLFVNLQTYWFAIEVLSPKSLSFKWNFPISFRRNLIIIWTDEAIQLSREVNWIPSEWKLYKRTKLFVSPYVSRVSGESVYTVVLNDDVMRNDRQIM